LEYLQYHYIGLSQSIFAIIPDEIRNLEILIYQGSLNSSPRSE